MESTGTSLVQENIPAAEPSQIEPSQMEIAQLAYALWEERAGGFGNAEEDWYRAEQMLRNP